MRRIAFLAVPPVFAYDLSITQMLLGAAELADGPAYRVTTHTAHPGRVAAVGGPDLLVPDGLAGLRELGEADTVVVVGGGAREDVAPAVLDAVRRSADAGRRVAAICTGTFVLGHAGLLDGRRATTHWGLTEQLARRFPAATVERDALHVVDGPIVTSAGAGAAIELCLHLIRTDHGSAVAAAAGRLAVVGPPRPGDQPQIVETPLPRVTDRSLADTRAWALRRLDRPLALADLAAHAGVSTRTLIRRFHAETGLSPLRWLLHQRVDRARQLLETTELPMDRVAHHSGLGSADSLRQHLVRALGLTPSAYRAAAAKTRVTAAGGAP
ncbi:GlxA family transcriptional regulator [Streptomyces mayteni]